MGKLTEEAKERYGLPTQFRFWLASACISLGFRIMPRDFWDDLKRKELIQMCERKGVKPSDLDD